MRGGGVVRTARVQAGVMLPTLTGRLLKARHLLVRVLAAVVDVVEAAGRVARGAASGLVHTAVVDRDLHFVLALEALEEGWRTHQIVRRRYVRQCVSAPGRVGGR